MENESQEYSVKKDGGRLKERDEEGKTDRVVKEKALSSCLSVFSSFVMQIPGSAFPLPIWKVAVDLSASGLCIRTEW